MTVIPTLEASLISTDLIPIWILKLTVFLLIAFLISNHFEKERCASPSGAIWSPLLLAVGCIMSLASLDCVFELEFFLEMVVV